MCCFFAYFRVEFWIVLSNYVEVLANKKITVIINNRYLYLGASCYPSSISPSEVLEGYPVKDGDAMNEEIFLQVIIILVIAILGSNQKKTLINSAIPFGVTQI